MFNPESNAKVEIRPIEIEKWHGHKGKDSFAKPKKIQALVDSASMTYATGLTKEDINALKKLNISYDLSNIYLPGVPHSFWDTKITQLALPNHPIFLNIKHPLEYIKYSIAKASKYIANSMKEYEEGQWPEATHVLYDESENIEEAAGKAQLHEDAIIEAHGMTADKKIDIIQILEGKNMKGQSDNAIKVKMKELIDRDPQTFLIQAKKDSSENNTHALVLRALDAGALRRDGHKIMHMDAMLGNDEIEVVNYLKLEENQELKLLLLRKLNS